MPIDPICLQKYDEIKELLYKGAYSNVSDLIDSTLKSNPRCRFIILIIKSRYMELTGNFEAAYEIVNDILSNNLAVESTITQSYAVIAQSYALWRLTKFEDAINLINNQERILKKNETILNPSLSKKIHGSLYNIKGLIFWSQNLLEEAMDYFKKGLNFRQQEDLKIDIGYSLNNIGNTYLKMKDYKNAEIYYNKSFVIRRQLGLLPGLAASYNSLGRLDFEKQNYMQAEINFQKSLELWIKLKNFQFIGKAYRFIGLNFIKQGKIKEAKENFNQAIINFQKIPNITDLRITQKLYKDNIQK